MVRSLARWMVLYRPVRSWRPRTRAIWETVAADIFASAMAWSWAAIARLIASRVSRMRFSQAGGSLTVMSCPLESNRKGWRGHHSVAPVGSVAVAVGVDPPGRVGALRDNAGDPRAGLRQGAEAGQLLVGDEPLLPVGVLDPELLLVGLRRPPAGLPDHVED